MSSPSQPVSARWASEPSAASCRAGRQVARSRGWFSCRSWPRAPGGLLVGGQVDNQLLSGAGSAADLGEIGKVTALWVVGTEGVGDGVDD
jgi:hypothetical protein